VNAVLHNRVHWLKAREGEAVPWPPICRSVWRVTHKQQPARPKQGSGTLCRDGGGSEATSDYEIEATTKLGIPADQLRSLGHDRHPIRLAQYLYRFGEKGGPLLLTVYEYPFGGWPHLAEEDETWQAAAGTKIKSPGRSACGGATEHQCMGYMSLDGPRAEKPQ